MNLDELDLSNVPEAVVRAARSGWQVDNTVWVVTMGDATGLLVATRGGAVWHFRSTTWTMRWADIATVVTMGDRAVTVGDPGSEEYVFSFVGPEERADFLRVRDDATRHSRAHGGDSRAPLPIPERGGATATLKMLFCWGIVLALAAGLTAISPDARVLSLFLIVPAQVCLGVAVIGWGVMLGTRAAQES